MKPWLSLKWLPTCQCTLSLLGHTKICFSIREKIELLGWPKKGKTIRHSAHQTFSCQLEITPRLFAWTQLCLLVLLFNWHITRPRLNFLPLLELVLPGLQAVMATFHNIWRQLKKVPDKTSLWSLKFASVPSCLCFFNICSLICSKYNEIVSC